VLAEFQVDEEAARLAEAEAEKYGSVKKE